MNNHVMVDIESLGQEAGSVITSVSAIQFNIETGAIGNKFYSDINVQSCLDAGLKVEASTILWWLQQENHSREKFIKGQQISERLEDFLRRFYYWFDNLPHATDRSLLNRNDIYVWGRGPRFDFGLLSYVYNKSKYGRTPWNFRNEVCVRTMEFLHPEIKRSTVFTGILHNAEDDNLHQIKYISNIFNKIKSNGTNN